MRDRTGPYGRRCASSSHSAHTASVPPVIVSPTATRHGLTARTPRTPDCRLCGRAGCGHPPCPRHEQRVGSPRRTLRLLPHDPVLLLRLRDPLPRGERVPVELSVGDIHQRHRPERPDIAHHALDPIRERPARVSRVELPSMTAPKNVPIAPLVPFLLLVPTMPVVPFGNRPFRGVVHVEIHRFRPTVAAMMVATRHRPLVVPVTCPLWT